MESFDIPEDIFMIILSFVDTSDLYPISNINTTSKGCFLKNSNFWKKRLFKLSEIKHYYLMKYVQILEIDIIPNSKLEIFQSKTLQLKKIFISLNNYETECSLRSIFVTFLSASNNVEFLSIDFPINDDWIRSITKNCQKLISLSIENNIFKNQTKIHQITNLKHLQFNIHKDLSNFDSLSLSPKFPNLVSLSVKFGSVDSILLNFVNETDYMLTSLKKLRYLTFIWPTKEKYEWVSNAKFSKIQEHNKPFKTMRFEQNEHFKKFIMINEQLLDSKDRKDCEIFLKETTSINEQISKIKTLQLYKINNEIVLDFEFKNEVFIKTLKTDKITIGIKRK